MGKRTTRPPANSLYMLFVIVGLGNPGKAYQANRHNIGFMVVDHLAEQHGISWEAKGRSRFGALTGQGVIEDQRVWLVKPQTYMNLSGDAVGAVSRFYKVPLEGVVVIHDDIDLDLGRVQVRRGGGHGGHRGLASIIERLGDPGFARIRVGVDRPPLEMEARAYVLQDFTAAEQPDVTRAVERAGRAVQLLVTKGLTTAMNRVNPWPVEENEE